MLLKQIGEVLCENELKFREKVRVLAEANKVKSVIHRSLSSRMSVMAVHLA